MAPRALYTLFLAYILSFDRKLKLLIDISSVMFEIINYNILSYLLK